jgi:hypothetical protein
MADFHYPVALGPDAIKRCRVVVSRDELAGLLPKRKLVAQIGAGLGDLSEVIVTRCNPQRLSVLDPFTLHSITDFWQDRLGKRAAALDHQQYFRERFAGPMAQGRIALVPGEIFETIPTLPDRGVGIAWIGNDTSYIVVRDHLQALLPKMANDGQIVISNYIMSDYLTGNAYGVIQATNEFIVANKWEMTLLVLQSNMFCDVVICHSR